MIVVGGVPDLFTMYRTTGGFMMRFCSFPIRDTGACTCWRSSSSCLENRYMCRPCSVNCFGMCVDVHVCLCVY